MGWGRGGIQDVRAALGGEGRRPRPRGIGTPCPPPRARCCVLWGVELPPGSRRGVNK